MLGTEDLGGKNPHFFNFHKSTGLKKKKSGGGGGGGGGVGGGGGGRVEGAGGWGSEVVVGGRPFLCVFFSCRGQL